MIAQCKAGVVGSFPALNARPAEELDNWLTRIKTELAEYDAANPDQLSAPFAVNQIVHGSNDRLMHDVEMCVKHEVPVVITSLGARPEVFDAIHSYGGISCTTLSITGSLEKRLKKAPTVLSGCRRSRRTRRHLSPMAFIQEVREWFDGPILLSGAIGTGDAVLAAQAMGADLAYLGSAFIATEEANAVEGYKQGIVDNGSSDIVYTNLFTGGMAIICDHPSKRRARP